MEHHETLKFLYLLERPSEPLYLGMKGHGTTIYLYNLPPDHLEPYQRQAMTELRKQIPSSTTIVEFPVYRTSVPYDLTPIQQVVSRKALFTEFNKYHQEASTALTNILLDQSTKADYFNACALCRDEVNPHLWVHAFARSVAVRKDMHGFRFPAIYEILPDMFIESEACREAINQAILPEKERAVVVLDKNLTGTNLNPEHKVAYFREDIGVNSHHWHWHLVNAFTLPKGKVDRKGELFYYMHHGMLARYDTERLANGLNRVVPFDMHRDMIEEGYFPKITIQNASKNLAGRQNNSILKDLNRSRDPDSNAVGILPLENIRTWCDRVIEAIDVGFAIQDGGGRIDLRNDRGIDVITAIWEASNDSPNKNYYGSPHNLGHVSISYVHDPDFRFREPPGAMYFQGTSMRDPSFYRWHRYLDLISKKLKDYLQPYPLDKLRWNGIFVNEIQMIRMEPSSMPMPNLNPLNNMVTHWMQSDVEVSRGLDFGRTSINGLGSVLIRTTHLQYVPFQYRIRITNRFQANVQATVRIFMAPKLDENGDQLPFFEQRNLFFEMDKFTALLQQGENTITQNGSDSTLTLPWTQTFRGVERDVDRPTRAQAICHCGWPDHLLLPRGKPDGMLFDVFVMLTPTSEDQVPTSRRLLTTLNAKGTCRDSISYCGLLDDKIPDSRPMNFPFDRPATADEKTKAMLLSDYVALASNMAAQEVAIYHVNKTILRDRNAPDDSRKIYVVP